MITYRELRLLELAVLCAVRESGQQVLDVQSLINVDVNQFYGIEIEEFPAQIAQVALWLTDHQMNMRVSEEFGAYFARIALNPRRILCVPMRYKPTGRKYCHQHVAVMYWVIRHLSVQSLWMTRNVRMQEKFFTE